MNCHWDSVKSDAVKPLDNLSADVVEPKRTVEPPFSGARLYNLAIDGNLPQLRMFDDRLERFSCNAGFDTEDEPGVKAGTHGKRIPVEYIRFVLNRPAPGIAFEAIILENSVSGTVKIAVFQLLPPDRD